jgi:hypothetical protein
MTGIGKGSDATCAAVAGRQEPGSDGRRRAMAPTHHTGACPLRQGRGKALTGGPRLQCPSLNPFKPVK